MVWPVSDDPAGRARRDGAIGGTDGAMAITRRRQLYEAAYALFERQLAVFKRMQSLPGKPQGPNKA